MQQQAITPISDLVDEGWELYFFLLKGLLTAIVRVAHFAGLVVFRLAQELFAAVCWLRNWVEAWVPVRPDAFGEYEDRVAASRE